jgi:hypothetical protein
MHFRSIIAIFALASTVSGAAVSQTAAPTAAAASQPEGEPDRIVCKLEQPTGSKIPAKVCKTAATWEWERERSRKMVQDAQQWTGSTNGR